MARRLTTRFYVYTCDACTKEHVYSGSAAAQKIRVGRDYYTACPKGARELGAAFWAGPERPKTSFQLRLPGLRQAPLFPKESAQ